MKTALSRSGESFPYVSYATVTGPSLAPDSISSAEGASKSLQYSVLTSPTDAFCDMTIQFDGALPSAVTSMRREVCQCIAFAVLKTACVPGDNASAALKFCPKGKLCEPTPVSTVVARNYRLGRMVSDRKLITNESKSLGTDR